MLNQPTPGVTGVTVRGLLARQRRGLVALVVMGLVMGTLAFVHKGVTWPTMGTVRRHAGPTAT